MLWFFERSNEQVEIETRFDNDAFEYVVVVRWPDGRARTERFADVNRFRTRLLALEQELQAEHWRNTGPPLFLPEGWPRRN